MKTRVQFWLILFGLLSFVVGWLICRSAKYDTDAMLKVSAAVIAFNFFLYKLLTGWLFINLSIKIETEREKMDELRDHLIIKLILNKGNIDSVWVESIQIRLSEVKIESGKNVYSYLNIIEPINLIKREPKDGEYWEGKPFKHYVISLGEEASFSAYTQVSKKSVIAAEVLLLGTTPFYGIENFRRESIQWRSSVFILPKSKSNHHHSNRS